MSCGTPGARVRVRGMETRARVRARANDACHALVPPPLRAAAHVLAGGLGVHASRTCCSRGTLVASARCTRGLETIMHEKLLLLLLAMRDATRVMMHS